MIALIREKNSEITLTTGLPNWLRQFLFDNCGRQFEPDQALSDADLVFAIVGCDEVPIATYTTPMQHSFGICKAAAISVAKENAAVIENLKASLPQESRIEWAEGFAVLTVAPWRPNLSMKMFGFLYGT